MNRVLSIAAFACALSLTAPLSAQSAAGADGVKESYTFGVTFETVDSLRVQQSSDDRATLMVTGLLSGGSAPETKTFTGSYHEPCERMLTLSMERPGRYSVTVVRLSQGWVLECTLARK